LKSKRESAANSGSAQQRELVFFLDKCLGRKVVAEALRAAGEQVELQEDHFDKKADDTQWVPEVGRRGWIILTKDRALRHNSLELIALLKSNTHSFILTSADQTGEQMAKAFVAALPDMKNMIGKFPSPFVGTVTPLGKVHVFFTHDQLLAAIGDRR
jgi:predicted nuclease of predicted toxin-antitoxin system